METFVALCRKFKDKFYFVDKLEFNEDKKWWQFVWPSLIGPSRFFNQEGVFKITGHLSDRLWVLRVERTKIKVERLFITDKNCSAIPLLTINLIKLKEIQVAELVISVENNLAKTIKELRLPCKVSTA